MSKHVLEKYLELFTKNKWRIRSKDEIEYCNLVKYCIAPIMLRLCSQKLNDGKKCHWFNLGLHRFCYTNSGTNFKDLFFATKDVPCSNIIRHVAFRRDPFDHYRQAKSMFSYLNENHNNLLLKALDDLDLKIATANKRSIRQKTRHKKIAAVSFTKSEQIKIATGIYDQVWIQAAEKFEEIIVEILGAGSNFQIDVGEDLSSSNNYIIQLASKQYNYDIVVDLNGTKLFEELCKLNLDYMEILEQWASCDDKLLRRFALHFTKNIGLGLLDPDPKIRLASSLLEKSK